MQASGESYISGHRVTGKQRAFPEQRAITRGRRLHKIAKVMSVEAETAATSAGVGPQDGENIWIPRTVDGNGQIWLENDIDDWTWEKEAPLSMQVVGNEMQLAIVLEKHSG